MRLFVTFFAVTRRTNVCNNNIIDVWLKSSTIRDGGKRDATRLNYYTSILYFDEIGR